MEYISTSALANELDIKSGDLFDRLKSLGWIDRKYDKWVLTELGKQKGGQTRNNPKYGEFPMHMKKKFLIPTRMYILIFMFYRVREDLRQYILSTGEWKMTKNIINGSIKRLKFTNH